MESTLKTANQKMLESSRLFENAKKEIQKVVVGQEKIIHALFIALLTEGHIIMEGVPGVAKTLIAKTLSSVLDCSFKRIQFTPDLLPADILGTAIYHPEKTSFEISLGTIFTEILLADEINRAPAKVQSALLEAMEEGQVTIHGQTFPLPNPFMVLATQNPIEQTGTYPLPEAQRDRFMLKVHVDYPKEEEEKLILKRMTLKQELPKLNPVLNKESILQGRRFVNEVFIDTSVSDYLLKLVFATRTPKAFKIPIDPFISMGASPRGSIALSKAAKANAFLKGKSYVTPHDVKEVAHDVLRHRIHLTYQAEAEGINENHVIDQILAHIQVP